MSFQAFLDSIVSPDLRAVAEHWRTAKGSKAMPGWADIDPTAIGRALRYVWSWKYDAVSDTFTGRLAGEEIDRAFGKSLRGMAMTDFFTPEAYRKVFPRHRRVVTEPAFMHGSGMVFVHVDRGVIGERIILPLAEDGLHGDGIIGATVYHAAVPLNDDGKVADSELAAEEETYFALDADPRTTFPPGS